MSSDLIRIHILDGRCRPNRWQDVLVREECQRARRFLKDSDRDCFIARRVGLRQILAGELSLAARDVNIEYGASGKPMLSSTHGSSIQFSASSSQGLIAIAVSSGPRVGIDIEYVRQLADVMAVTEVAFWEEAGRLASMREPQRTHAFYECWVALEARGKFEGVGITQPLLRRNRPVRLFRIGHKYVGAICAEDKVTLTSNTVPIWS